MFDVNGCGGGWRGGRGRDNGVLTRAAVVVEGGVRIWMT